MAHPGQLSHKSSCGAQCRLRSFSPVSLFRKEAQVQHICRIVDITVCYNTKSAIQTVWNSGDTSDSVVIEWWTSLCDAKTGAYGVSQHRASSGPLRLHRWSHCVRALKADVQKEFDETVTKLHFIVSAHRLFPGTTRLYRSQG